ncbi:hypothetical protein VP01_1935g4 [Puccinia sorghi]|uniref:Uncharacterized protein n=1 Tax=Puccinia sorghi TaxID=27349 RepID=A0A0L6VCI0_9BASI|nr:hypothetical protein VP01_1935g4 [Puccinia sorghi]
MGLFKGCEMSPEGSDLKDRKADRYTHRKEEVNKNARPECGFRRRLFETRVVNKCLFFVCKGGYDEIVYLSFKSGGSFSSSSPVFRSCYNRTDVCTPLDRSFCKCDNSVARRFCTKMKIGFEAAIKCLFGMNDLKQGDCGMIFVLCLVKGCSVQTLMSWQLDQPVRSKSNNNWLGLNSAGSSDFTQTGNGISPGSDDQGSSSSRRDCQTSHVQQPLPIIIIIKTHTHKNHPAEPTRDDHGSHSPTKCPPDFGSHKITATHPPSSQRQEKYISKGTPRTVLEVCSAQNPGGEPTSGNGSTHFISVGSTGHVGRGAHVIPGGTLVRAPWGIHPVEPPAVNITDPAASGSVRGKYTCDTVKDRLWECGNKKKKNRQRSKHVTLERSCHCNFWVSDVGFPKKGTSVVERSWAVVVPLKSSASKSKTKVIDRQLEVFHFAPANNNPSIIIPLIESLSMPSRNCPSTGLGHWIERYEGSFQLMKTVRNRNSSTISLTSENFEPASRGIHKDTQLSCWNFNSSPQCFLFFHEIINIIVIEKNFHRLVSVTYFLFVDVFDFLIQLI